MPPILHGLIQKAKQDAEDLHFRERVHKDGSIWRFNVCGWVKIGFLADPDDHDSYLLGKLTQEEL